MANQSPSAHAASVELPNTLEDGREREHEHDVTDRKGDGVIPPQASSVGGETTESEAGHEEDEKGSKPTSNQKSGKEKLKERHAEAEERRGVKRGHGDIHNQNEDRITPQRPTQRRVVSNPGGQSVAQDLGHTVTIDSADETELPRVPLNVSISLPQEAQNPNSTASLNGNVDVSYSVAVSSGNPTTNYFSAQPRTHLLLPLSNEPPRLSANTGNAGTYQLAPPAMGNLGDGNGVDDSFLEHDLDLLENHLPSPMRQPDFEMMERAIAMPDYPEFQQTSTAEELLPGRNMFISDRTNFFGDLFSPNLENASDMASGMVPGSMGISPPPIVNGGPGQIGDEINAPQFSSPIPDSSPPLSIAQVQGGTQAFPLGRVYRGLPRYVGPPHLGGGPSSHNGQPLQSTMVHSALPADAVSHANNGAIARSGAAAGFHAAQALPDAGPSRVPSALNSLMPMMPRPAPARGSTGAPGAGADIGVVGGSIGFGVGRDISGTTSSEVRAMTEQEKAVVLANRKQRNRDSAKRSRQRRNTTLAELKCDIEGLRVRTSSIVRGDLQAYAVLKNANEQILSLTARERESEAELERLSNEITLLYKERDRVRAAFARRNGGHGS